MRHVRSAISLLLLLVLTTSKATNVGAPIGPDGRVMDTEEVAIAKAEHAAAHRNQKLKLAKEAARSGADSDDSEDENVTTAPPKRTMAPAAPKNRFAPVVQPAPIGPDGRVLDTPEVAAARAAHAAAHVNEKIKLVNEAARSSAADSLTPLVPLPVLAYTRQTSFLTPTLGQNGIVVDTPEVLLARAAHAAAHINERINLAREEAKSANALGVDDIVLTGGFVY